MQVDLKNACIGGGLLYYKPNETVPRDYAILKMEFDIMVVYAKYQEYNGVPKLEDPFGLTSG